MRILLLSCLFFSFLWSLQAQTTGRLIPKKGLMLESQGVQWAMGSELNFFNRDKQNTIITLPGGNRILIQRLKTGIFYFLVLKIQLFLEPTLYRRKRKLFMLK
jgi:hypothetical protein